jgi:hypothetical protein
MRRAFTLASLLIAGSVHADNPTKSAEIEMRIAGIARVKSYRDIRVKNEKKQDIAVVHISVVWTDELKHLFLADSDLLLIDVMGGQNKCALKFIQAEAPKNLAPTAIEMPFKVKAGVALKRLQIGKRSLDLTSAPPWDEAAPAAPAAPPR